MRYVLNFSKKARADLAQMDELVTLRIVAKLVQYASAPNPFRYAKPLTGGSGIYRFRIGSYRAIFEVIANEVVILEILRVGHRKDIYRDRFLG